MIDLGYYLNLEDSDFTPVIKMGYEALSASFYNEKKIYREIKLLFPNLHVKIILEVKIPLI